MKFPGERQAFLLRIVRHGVGHDMRNEGTEQPVEKGRNGSKRLCHSREYREAQATLHGSQIRPRAEPLRVLIRCHRLARFWAGDGTRE